MTIVFYVIPTKVSNSSFIMNIGFELDPNLLPTPKTSRVKLTPMSMFNKKDTYSIF